MHALDDEEEFTALEDQGEGIFDRLPEEDEEEGWETELVSVGEQRIERLRVDQF